MPESAIQIVDPAERSADSSKHDSSAEPCPDLPIESRIEALVLSTDRPLTEARIADLLGQERKGASKRVQEAIESLNAEYEKSGRSFRVERLAGGWQLLTLPEFGPLLHRQHAERQSMRLSQAALETLSIVAYRQPIMRAEIEAIRGVACGEVLRSLLERRMVAVVGRAEELGRPMLYGTTGQFLRVFGLSSTDDLPEVEGLQAGRPVPSPPKTGAPRTESETEPAPEMNDNEPSAPVSVAPIAEQPAASDG